MDDYWADKPREWYCKHELTPKPMTGPTHCLHKAGADGYCTQHRPCVWTLTEMHATSPDGPMEWMAFITDCGHEYAEDYTDQDWIGCPWCRRSLVRKTTDVQA